MHPKSIIIIIICVRSIVCIEKIDKSWEVSGLHDLR